MSNKIKNSAIWLVPIVTALLIVVFAVFVRVMIGSTRDQDINYGTKPFVPGESPYSTNRPPRPPE